ncbi:MAG: TetR/AcrR family transcriptional regulator [Actinomycetota bacterium]|nr:TetR/AcrR family transcriptional regulator [Actinomycetota bacterium]
MSVQLDATPVRGRPRDERADVAIAAALLALLEEAGYAAVTMGAVAARAGVSKATLYRRHGSKAELVFATVIHGRTLETPDTGTLRGDLRLLGQRIVADVGSPAAAGAIPGLLADLALDPLLRARFQESFIASEQSVIAELLGRARVRGELAAAADPDLVHALLLGSIFASLFLLDLSGTDALGERLAALTATAVERPRP